MKNSTSAAPARPQIGRFLLTRKLGKGGQGTVYLAEDPTLERRVAIKVVHAETPGGESTPGTLPQEARMAARMQHPSIVSIYDVGHFRGHPYLVFEFVEGRTFREILKAEGAMPASRALALIRPVLQGMAHAHERDVLHLDMTPGNILLSERDVPRIMDFGLAQFVAAVRDTTAMPVGTLLYMAPEQLEERPLGPPCDVRAVGLVLYELLTGKSAIEARTIGMAAREICEQDIDLTDMNTGADLVPIRDFLAGALERDPAARYPNAVAMLQAFDVAMEARAAIERGAYGKPVQGAVEFLIRRMQRRQDFPALSRSLVEINRMTAKDSTATASQLATVVLRDFALTNKLLKLANSAFYGVLAGEVKSISHAISLLGFEQLRVTANSLTLFSHVKDRSKSRGLRELLIRSFVAGLVARHLAQRDNLGYAEEAFICGMFQTLGETLTMFYFSEEHEDIVAVAAQGHLSHRQATIQVLGADYSTLGAAIAQEWRFPKVIVEAIAGLPDDAPVEPPADDGQRLRDVSVFADRLCEILGHGAHERGREVFAPLHAQFKASITLNPEEVVTLAESALGKLESQSAILGVNCRASTWCEAARTCLADASRPVEDPGATLDVPQAEPRGHVARTVAADASGSRPAGAGGSAPASGEHGERDPTSRIPAAACDEVRPASDADEDLERTVPMPAAARDTLRAAKRGHEDLERTVQIPAAELDTLDAATRTGADLERTVEIPAAELDALDAATRTGADLERTVEIPAAELDARDAATRTDADLESTVEIPAAELDTLHAATRTGADLERTVQIPAAEIERLRAGSCEQEEPDVTAHRETDVAANHR